MPSPPVSYFLTCFFPPYLEKKTDKEHDLICNLVIFRLDQIIDIVVYLVLLLAASLSPVVFKMKFSCPNIQIVAI
ncbi:hypothetical protein RIF29_14316 [Crotalaria pallida]|uniref:Uncharacterized protein n=1 Tax=Crotalaria pallida TaxID=3830 RepID=A0AAN9FB32_CROPI